MPADGTLAANFPRWFRRPPFWQLANQDIPPPLGTERENFRTWPDSAVSSIRRARKLSGASLGEQDAGHYGDRLVVPRQAIRNAAMSKFWARSARSRLILRSSKLWAIVRISSACACSLRSHDAGSPCNRANARALV